MSSENEELEEPNQPSAVRREAAALSNQLNSVFAYEDLTNRQYALLCHTSGLLSRAIEGRGGSSKIADNMIEFCSLFEFPIEPKMRLAIQDILSSGTAYGITIDEHQDAKRRSGWDWRVK